MGEMGERRWKERGKGGQEKARKSVTGEMGTAAKSAIRIADARFGGDPERL
jgi:hypothetical protein